MKKIWTLLVAAITVLAVLTSGCSSSDKTAKPADGKKTTTIGFSISTLNNPFFVSVRKGVEEEEYVSFPARENCPQAGRQFQNQKIQKI